MLLMCHGQHQESEMYATMSVGSTAMSACAAAARVGSWLSVTRVVLSVSAVPDDDNVDKGGRETDRDLKLAHNLKLA